MVETSRDWSEKLPFALWTNKKIGVTFLEFYFIFFPFKNK